MTTVSPTKELGRRERELLEIVYKIGTASAAEVRAEMAEQTSYSAVRTMLTLLERKGYLRHERVGTRYVYAPTQPKSKARVSALRHVVDTFFDGSIESVVLTLVSARKLPASRL